MAVVLEPHELCVNPEEWSQVYEKVKEYCDFTAAIEFLERCPGAANNRAYSGCTLLHQALWWGVDKGIIELLKNCGSDPNLRDKQGRLPLDMCQTEEKRADMERVMVEVFGNDDAESRLRLLAAAREGNFATVMQLLRQQPHLVNTQGRTGWSVMHQAAFHGASPGLVATLVQLKASLRLRNDEGKTPATILAECHPASRLSLSDRPAAALVPGARVAVHAPSGRIFGVVVAISDGEVSVDLPDGQQRREPLWRVCPVADVPTEAEAESALGSRCWTCNEPVLPSWTVSRTCSGDPHPMCGDCIATFLWSQFTLFKLPISCGVCRAPVDPGAMPGALSRTLMASWPPGSRWGNPATHLNYVQFVQNVQEKLRDKQRADDDDFKLELLRASPPTPRPIEYCNFSGAPARRACPRCGVIIEYESACKHMTCTLCSHRFCFLCLRSEGEHGDLTYSWRISVACPVAPLQTVIPHLPG